ncbi:MAG TPA: spore germination protein [Symbiobacteriaceae bacterium]|jgi:hypothetical protein
MPSGGPAGPTLRTVARPGGARFTVAYVEWLVEPADVQQLVLAPLGRTIAPAPPDDLAVSGRFPAPELRVAKTAEALLTGLQLGLAAVHVDGYPAALLAGSGKVPKIPEKFTPELVTNLQIIRRLTRRPGLRVEILRDIERGRSAIAYFDELAPPELVQSVRSWAEELSSRGPVMSWWPALLGIFRLPSASECFHPAAVLEALEKGYLVVLAQHMPFVLVAPLTLPLLLYGSNDRTMYRPLRTIMYLPRLAAVGLGLLTAGWFVAVTSYHHALLPGPFLTVLAAARRNLPFPLVMEVALIQLIADTLWIGTLRLAARGSNLLAFIGICLAAMVLLQGGLAAPISAALGVGLTATLMVIPSLPLDRFLRAWRYLFILAASALGIYGMAILGFLLMVYLGDARPFGHPLWREPIPPPAVSSS